MESVAWRSTSRVVIKAGVSAEARRPEKGHLYTKEVVSLLGCLLEGYLALSVLEAWSSSWGNSWPGKYRQIVPASWGRRGVVGSWLRTGTSNVTCTSGCLLLCGGNNDTKILEEGC